MEVRKWGKTVSDNQRIKSGDESENYQAGGDITVNQGMSYMDVKDVAMTVFENNFAKLGEQVEVLVMERAERLINAYLEKIRTENPEALANTIDPDIRAGIYEAQKDFARSGKEDVEKLLVDLLVERTVSVDSDFKNIILNEALLVASKLSKTQIDILTVSYIGNYISFNTITDPFQYSLLISPYQYLFDSNIDTHSDYRFLSYLGCIDISIGSIDFTRMISGKNIAGFTTEDESRASVSNYPVLLKMQSFWDSNYRSIQNSTTTPVGNVIATLNANRNLGYKNIPFIL